MAETAGLLTLMSWLSPAFPTGGFAYSAGLEQAAVESRVRCASTLREWIAHQVGQGGPRNDAILLARAHDAALDITVLSELSDLARALCVSMPRLRETCEQGTSFLAAAAHWIEVADLAGQMVPLPVAVGACAGRCGIDRHMAVAGHLHGFVSNQLQCAIRLSITGQGGAAAVLSALEPEIVASAKSADTAALEDLGGAAFVADIAAMRHEVLEARLFLS